MELREVGNYFMNKGITLSTDNNWVRSCVECFKTQCSNCESKELLDFVFEQWLLADLREIGSFSLPKECSTADKFVIVGKHAIQLNYIVDVGNSSYAQLQKLRKPNLAENLITDSENAIKEQSYFHKTANGRSLKMELSDGQLTVIAFEDQYVPCLKNPVPGEKALLIGPIECRKGILLLKEKNIEMLGGEVDTLLIPNAVGNVLARLLGEPQDPDPYKQNGNSQITNVSNELLSDCLQEDNEALIMLAESVEMSTNPASISNMEVKQKTAIGNSFDFGDDDEFDIAAAQTATLAELEASNQKEEIALFSVDTKTKLRKGNVTHFNFNKEANSNTCKINEAITKKIKNIAAIKNILTNTDSDEYIDINDPKRLKRELEQSYGERSINNMNTIVAGRMIKKKLNINEQTRFRSKFSGMSCDPNIESSIEVDHKLNFTNLNSPTNKRGNQETNKISKCNSIQEISATFLNKQKQPSTSFDEENESLPWLNQNSETMDSERGDLERASDNNSESFYQSYPPRKFPSLRLIRGQIVHLSEKLSLKNDQWCLSAVVLANGLEIEMTFASEVLDKIFGFKAAELVARKNDLKTNPAAKEQMNKLLRESQLRIRNLRSEMVIRFPSVIAKPIIIDVIQK